MLATNSVSINVIQIELYNYSSFILSFCLFAVPLDALGNDLPEDEDETLSTTSSRTHRDPLNLGTSLRTVLPHNGDEAHPRAMDEHICGICRAEFVGLARFIAHKKECHSNEPIVVPAPPPAAEEGEEDENETITLASKTNHSSKAGTEGVISTKRKTSSVREETPDKDRSDGAVLKPESPPDSSDEDNSRSSPTFNESNVLIQSLRNARVAVAQQQFSSPSTSDHEGLGSPPQLSPQAAAAQLCSLQQQHVMLMSVIHQLTSQLMTNQGGAAPSNPGLPIPLLMPPTMTPGVALADRIRSRSPDCNPLKRESPSDHTSQVVHPKRIALSSNRDPVRSRHSDKPLNIGDNPNNSMHALQNLISEACPLKRMNDPSGLSNSKSKLVSVDIPASRDEASLPLIPSPVNEPAPVSEPNTLELLQRHTEQALQNTMSGSSFLVNGVSGSGGNEFLRFRKDGKEDPSLRHRCKYCGKVFGSDSALQIHIRSHTGERPFKCNICGNRFSTKGNLKVHFQRHRAKYPHVKMNPNPVPEHLDKFHPPLEPPSGSQSPTRSQSPLQPIFPSGFNNSLGGNNPHIGTMAQNAMTSFSHSIPNMIQTAMDLKAKIDQTKEYIASAANNGGSGANRSLGSLMSQMDLQSKSSMELQQLKTCQSSPPRMRSPSHDEHSRDSCSTDSSGEADGQKTKKERKSSEFYDKNREKNLKPGEDEHNGRGGGSEIEDGKRSEKEPSEEYEVRRKMKRETCDAPAEEDESVTERSGPPGYHHSRQDSCHELSDNEQPEDEDENEDRGILRKAAMKAAAELNRRKSRQNDEDDDDESNESDTNSFKRGLSGKEDMGDDDDGGRIGNKFPFLAPNFQSFFQHGMFPSSMGGMMPPFSIPPTMTTASTAGANHGTENGAISGDPILYQDLLPKPGSTDNSWESLMEIQKASETTKLQNLVDNIENKLTDPNQCIICHRILSCKSALQMHYRTHTGERPFKCKICGRAFTTKGNLKTHMGVHRVKPPLRILHQCPVCHKQFTNALVLQQHIRIHTGEPTDMSPEHMLANEIKSPLGSFLPNSAFHRHLMAAGHFARHPLQPPHPGMGHPFFPSLQPQDAIRMGLKVNESENGEGSDVDDELEDGSRRSLAVSEELSEGVPSKTSEISSSPPSPVDASKDEKEQRSRSPSMSTSLAALENHVKTINSGPPSVPPIPFGAFGMGLHQLQYQRYMAAQEQNRQQMKVMDEAKAGFSPNSRTSKESVDGRTSSVGQDGRSTPGSKHETDPGIAVDLTPKVPIKLSTRPELPITPDGGMQSPGQVMTPPQLAPPMFPPMFAGLPFPSGRTSTTCRICLKTFACNSALEIHYRSHTKERPFKCEVCDRGFSTKGNMKQHMLTHKIRDLPTSLYTTTTTPSSMRGGGSNNPRSVGSSALSCDSNGSDSSLNPSQMTKQEAEAAETGSLPGKESGGNSDSVQRPNRARSSSPGDGKRPSSSSIGSNRHICSVCRKPFSSHSALQIHMRTHTGDKPFQCSICSRAFTTKGNLKVHMGRLSIVFNRFFNSRFLIKGTHMWNNGSSRRGRRMSIDLPNLHMNPTNGSNGSYPPGFYPMIPMDFMNGELTCKR